MKARLANLGSLLKRTSGWLPTVLVLAITLIAGGRLIVLSLERSAYESRTAATASLAQTRRAIEAQFNSLAGRAALEAARATRGLSGSDQRRLAEVLPGANTFWLEGDGTVLRSKSSDPTLSAAIASEWSTLEPMQGAPDAGFLAPTRQGSQWIVAARAPIYVQQTGSGGGQRLGWAVSYAELDRLLANAKVGRLVDEGYDFALAQVDPVTKRARTLVNAGQNALSDPMRSVVRTPSGYVLSGRGEVLELDIRPREGWYPVTRLASELGLLALVAWLLAFGTHDLIHRSHQLQQALTDSRKRQLELSEKLTSEIEERQDLQKSFDHARYHDAFTGLPNRRFFMDQLDRALREVRARRRQGVAVVLIDVDRFKLINETLGHAAGDELMVQAARRFEKSAAAMECILARWGGDQFALLLFDVPMASAALGIANMLQETLREPFELRRHRLSVTASMGLTAADASPHRAEDVLREADIALSMAKRPGNVRTMLYTQTMGGHAESLVSLEADLHLALERKELRLLFQPIVDLRNRQVVGAEALLRWQHPVEGTLTPDKFLAIAEESGLMGPITHWVISRVGRTAGEWRKRLPPNTSFYISINLSAGALRDPTLTSHVQSTLQQFNLPPGTLKFELTEAGLISNVGAAREVLETLHSMGVQLMLDDFGTGYSSLNHLELFPFDYVKIDRPFVNRLGSESANSGIMAAVVQIASSLGLKAIAEVIETPAAAQALQRIGCDYAQGYFFGPPVEAEEALQRLRLRENSIPGVILSTKERDKQGPQDDSPTLILPVVTP